MYAALHRFRRASSLNRDQIVTNLVLGGGTELGFEFNDTAFPMATDIEGNALASERIETKYVIDGPWDPASPIFTAAA